MNSRVLCLLYSFNTYIVPAFSYALDFEQNTTKEVHFWHGIKLRFRIFTAAIFQSLRPWRRT